MPNDSNTYSTPKKKLHTGLKNIHIKECGFSTTSASKQSEVSQG